MSHILHRNPRTTLARAVSAEGSTIVDHLGRRYLDASGGAAVSCLGHRHPDVVAAIRAQLDAIEYAHTSFFTTDAAEELAALLAEQSPPSLGHAYFVSGGSEAVETALKMARHYFVASGRPSKARFIARRQSYHGNTIAALGLGGNAARRALYEPLMAPSVHVSPCFAFRWRERGESDEAYATRLARELEETILALGAENVAGFVAETVVGATAGAVAPVPGYFRKIREVCDRHQVLLILDEVMCGMGRTGTYHAFEQEGVEPDLLTLAKGLGGGYQPIGAVLASERIAQALNAVGGFQHGFTYVGHPVAAAAALAVQKVIRRDGLVARSARAGERLAALLQDRFGDHPHVGDLRGRGLLQAIELVADRASGAAFDPSLQLHAAVKQVALARGLICYPSGGTIDGVRGDHVLLAPSFLASDAELAQIVDLLASSIDDAIASATRRAPAPAA
jgi:adenosylmethionine-8-amino-7-oxononanoate aminotransferase